MLCSSLTRRRPPPLSVRAQANFCVGAHLRGPPLLWFEFHRLALFRDSCDLYTSMAPGTRSSRGEPSVPSEPSSPQRQRTSCRAGQPVPTSPGGFVIGGSRSPLGRLTNQLGDSAQQKRAAPSSTAAHQRDTGEPNLTVHQPAGQRQQDGRAEEAPPPPPPQLPPPQPPLPQQLGSKRGPISALNASNLPPKRIRTPPLAGGPSRSSPTAGAHA